MLEKAATASLSVVAPTATAEEMQPGPPKALVKLALPDAITVAMSTERRLSMTALVAASSLSQVAWSLYSPPPKLMLTAAMFRVPAS